MPARLFTSAYLRSLRPKDRRYEVREPGGLGLWVYPSGRKTWMYTYTVGGRKFRLKIGEYPRVGLAEARKLVVAAKADIAQGINPQLATRRKRQEMKRQGLTVRDLVRAYIERWAKPRKRSWAEDQRRLKADVVRAWGHRPASEITRADVRELLDEVLERGPYAANRLFATMRRMFNWAVEVDLLPASPCWQVRMPAQEQPRERVLTPAEIRAFWWGLEGFSHVRGDAFLPRDSVRRALRVLLLTAQRPGEVSALPWAEVEGEWWTIPGERTKNRKTHRVPLTPLVLELLGEPGGEWVFPGRAKPITPTDLGHAIQQYRRLTGVERFTPHDLRRTAASGMASLGVPRLVIRQVLNHTDPTVTAVYDRHSYDREKREALEAWERRVREITGAR
ncbi:tyrosine-type recombinase/integrase [Deferrisoma camini]|uniref:tyrosine-type recombinase/integrase n=1 Tax=Deferrisoma camini TaxID=1035120 RepID=UPI00046C955D|nr:site-specific integrase [Deferrisoma camini]